MIFLIIIKFTISHSNDVKAATINVQVRHTYND